MMISQQTRCGDQQASQATYWQQKLRGAPTGVELPFDSTRSSAPSWPRNEERIELSASMSAQLKQFVARENITLLTAFLTAFNTLWLRYTGQEDIVVGSVTVESCRQTVAGSLESFTNPLALRTFLATAQSAGEALQNVTDTLHEAAEHRDYPFADLVNDTSHPTADAQAPIFQTMLVLCDHPTELSQTPVSQAALLDISDCMNERDLVLLVSECEDRLAINCRYSARFKATSIRRMLGHLQCLLTGMITDPQQQLTDLPLLTAAERHQQLVEWNLTERDYPQACIHKLFEAQVEQAPEAIAVVFEGERLTYRALNQRANQVAHQLQNLGIGPESLVGICVERSPDMVVGLLAILKAGGAYLPLDPAYPADRLAYMLEDSQVSVLLTQAALQDQFSAFSLQFICLDEQAQVANQIAENPNNPVHSEQLAYVIYTSGSTGRPKGVLVTHRGIPNLAAAQCRTFAVQPSSRILQFASFSFDASISEVFMALSIGASLYLASRESLMPGPALLSLLQTEAITHVTLPPSVLAVLPSTELPALESIIVAGEACHGSIVAQWSQQRRFFNAYGPTEATVCATIAECKSDGACPPIGRPIDNTQLYILDPRRQPLPVGTPGELYIGGIGLTRGYLNRPDLTIEKFIPNPFGEGRLYRTGDLVRYRPDGNIEFLGRLDHQVKIRGFRIELGEIEAVLSQHKQVQNCIVIAREDTPGNKRLVAYVVAHDFDLKALKQSLKAQLPEYMVPSVVVPLAALPLTPNGKVDRKALPAPATDRGTADFVAPRTPIEQHLATIWTTLLQLESVGLYDNFFELGGHSLVAVQLCTVLEKKLGITLPPAVLLQAPTLAQLAAHLDAPEKFAQPWSSLVPIQPQGSKPPLFCIHGAGANVLMFRDLAQNLGTDQPFYALQSRALDGKELPLTTIEAMADAYLQEIRSFYPNGPYLLAGYSMGNFIALEIAHRLTSEGKDVALLALFDPPPLRPPGRSMNHSPASPSKPKPFARRRWFIAKQKSLRAILKFHKAFGLPLLPILRLFPALRLFNVQEENIKAAAQYVTDVAYPHLATLFLTPQSRAKFPALEQSWGAIAAALTIYDVPGCHGVVSADSFLKEPNVKTLAAHLTTSIEKAIERATPQKI
ncbi:MAG: amino acid adenylation domain-containing protein [Cyanobacteria bacterium P01_A01_bin.17]